MTRFEILRINVEWLLDNPEPGCVEWPYSRTRGYGCYGGGRTHRTALSMKVGRKLLTTEYALHHCDNPPCLNPAHLYLGDQYDNMADMKRRERERKAHGAVHGMAKVSAAEVEEIRQLRNAGVSRLEVAEKFKLSPTHVSRICTRQQRRLD